jgi:spore coat polysaccharide biosynthesis protein SpsF
MKAVAIVQARLGSTRLPGKIMRELCGRTVLAHVIQRVRTSGLDDVVVATSSLAQDDVIAEAAEQAGAGVYRGSEDDVLDRYLQAATQSGADPVIRITSDCPLIDPTVVRDMVATFCRRRSSGEALDYLSNTIERTYPIGLDTEVFTYSALRRAWIEARLPYEREHVTPYIYQHPSEFPIAQFRNERDLSALRWTLDTPEDFEFLRAVYEALWKPAEIVSTSAVLALLQERPELAKINVHVKQRTF